jgi:hypothetical protein
MDQTFLASRDLAANQQIQHTDGMLVNAILMVVGSLIIAERATNWLESKPQIVKLMAHGRPKNFPFAFVSIVKSQVNLVQRFQLIKRIVKKIIF